jgi:Flagellar P-ring protein
MIRRGVLLAGLLVLAGCTSTSTQQVRSQAEDELSDHGDDVKTIGEVTSVGNADPIPVIGIGLVINLPNPTGGCPPGSDRVALEEELKKRGVENVKEKLDSPYNALVRVAALIPAAAHKGDLTDVTVAVPEGSRCTSLRGGYLSMCKLFNFDSTQHISPDPTRGDRLLRGHEQVYAEGPVVAGLAGEGSAEDKPSQRAGCVWGGGRVLGADRVFTLELKPNLPFGARVAMQVERRVNETFHGPAVGGAGVPPLATAKTNQTVTLGVPGAYRQNLMRYLRVVRLIPLNEQPAVDGPYCQKLEQQLLDPGTTITAALRLEALGPQSIPMLKAGLNSEHPLVRFAAAEALAYLGSPSCAEELAKQVVEQPHVQAYALTALASLNEAICHVKLTELLNAVRPETRYGAFRALRALDETDATVRGVKFGNAFWLHRVAPDGPPQIHLATTKRAEVVLFGESPKLVPPFSILAGPEFTLTAKDGESCTLSRFTTGGGKKSRQCSLEVADVLKALADLGGTYADAVELLRQADECRGLNCALKVDTLPKAPSVYDLAKAGLDASGTKAEIGATPTLYERPTAGRPRNPRTEPVAGGSE